MSAPKGDTNRQIRQKYDIKTEGRGCADVWIRECADLRNNMPRPCSGLLQQVGYAGTLFLRMNHRIDLPMCISILWNNFRNKVLI